MTFGSLRPSAASLPPSGAGVCSCSFIWRLQGASDAKRRGAGVPHRCPCVSRQAKVGARSRDDSLSGVRSRCENGRVVVQCPSCQSRFRVADEKVTDRGVRVRCSSCKDVFSVKKSGVTETAGSPGSGNTIDLSSLDPPVPPARMGGSTGKIAVLPKPGQKSPAAGRVSQPPIRAKAAEGRLDADDLFGMSELTGETEPKAGGANKSRLSLDDLDLGD